MVILLDEDKGKEKDIWEILVAQLADGITSSITEFPYCSDPALEVSESHEGHTPAYGASPTPVPF